MINKLRSVSQLDSDEENYDLDDIKSEGLRNNRKIKLEKPRKPGSPGGSRIKDDSINDDRGYLSRSSSTLKTYNHSTGTIHNKFMDQGLIYKTARELTNETIQVELTIRIIVKRLEAQAHSFARKMRSQQDLNLKRILNVQEYKWNTVLEQAYIYSYMRGLLYALTDSRVAERPSGKSALIGHEILQLCLLQSSWTFEHKELYVNYFFNISEKDLQSIYTVARSYPYIKDYLSLKPRFFLENEKLDRVLDELHAHSFPGGPIFVKIGDDDRLNMYLTKDNFPIANSFYTSKSDENEWHFAYSEEFTILNGSMLFGKSCFVTCVDDSQAREYYEQIYRDDQYYLVKYELSATCGSIYPTPMPDFKLGK
jgi:hypothetical protein